MIIWFALGIPFLTAAVLLVCFGYRCKWWELAAPFVISLVLVGTSKFLIEHVQTSDTEYWTGWVDYANYYEAWDELVTYTETETYTDSKGKTHTRTVTKTRVDYHSPYWEVVDSNGITVNITSQHFEQLCQRFGQRKFVNLHRNYHHINGNKYTTKWPGTDDTLEVVTTSHSYENRTIASESIFHFQKPAPQDKTTYGLYDYPEIKGYTMPSIVGVNDPVAERKLSIANAKLGKSKQVRIFVLVYKNQPVDAAIYQEGYWEGGNKNELVICIGTDDQNKVQWGKVFSWCEREGYKLAIRDMILEQQDKTLDLSKLVDEVVAATPEGWERKHFRDFNYLSVEPPTWAVVLTYVLTFLANVSVVVFAFKYNNDV